MTVLLFLSILSLLLSGPSEAASRHRRQQPVNISTSTWKQMETGLLVDETFRNSSMSKADDDGVKNEELSGIAMDNISDSYFRTVTEQTDSTLNMPDFENHPDFSNGDSVPLIPLDITPPDLGTNNVADTTCFIDNCKLWDPCKSDELCVTSPPPECESRCRKNGSDDLNLQNRIEEVPPDNSTTLRPLSERTCPGVPGLYCLHGVAGDCNGTLYVFSCQCDDGWTGFVCDEPCTLDCVHGACGVSIDGQMFCSCEHEYTGKTCDKLIPDPKERSRILAAVLSSALAVAVILIIIIPIIMWRLRVILILKLVYIFKEYEDEDGKEFDAYVSMTSTANAESFVYGSLRPILENQNFKLYLHARDAPAGEVMSETILSALEKSRRTIMIITPDYINNEWNRFEYLIAQHETLKLHQKIIPIILEDVEKDRVNMDKSLKHILDSIKCLKYPKVKPKSITSGTEESLEDIQSPDSIRSVDSTTHFYLNGSCSSTVSVPKEEQKFERKAAKFWKRLALTMPKKKTQKNTSFDFLSKLRKQNKYEISEYNCEDKSKIAECSMQAISECSFKINFINDINYHTFGIKSGNPCKVKDITEESNKEARLISTIA